jgi:hypothetical protein
MYFIQHLFICRPSDSAVSEDAGIEPRLLRLWYWQSDALTTLLDLIHYSARYHPLFLYAGTNLITRPVLFCSYSSSVPLIPCCFFFKVCSFYSFFAPVQALFLSSFLVLLQNLFLLSCLFPIHRSFPLLSRFCFLQGLFLLYCLCSYTICSSFPSLFLLELYFSFSFSYFQGSFP